MYKQMLVPLDGSELAEAVFPYVKELSARLDIDIVLLLVSSPSANAFVPMQKAYLEHTAEIMEGDIADFRKKLGVKSNAGKVKVECELAVGYAAEEILRYAEEKRIDLILMGTHGHSGMRRWNIGSVASKMLGASTVPVLLVRAVLPKGIEREVWPIENMLVPMDGSELAESVLPHVKALAKQRGVSSTDVVLLRVCEPPNIPSYYGPELSGVPMDWGQYVEKELVREKERAREYLSHLAKNKFRSKNIRVTQEVIQGKPDDEIVDYANKNRFSLIVTASHGRSGLSRLVYGSVAANLLHGVHSPILIVKPQQARS